MRATATMRRVVAAGAALALCLCAVGGCSADGAQEDAGQAVPEVVEPLEPVSGTEPSQAFGGSDEGAEPSEE